jgi:hypothetical protein
MSTTFTTLEIDTTIMRELYLDIFKDLTVTELKALKKIIAKNFLKDELYRVYKIDRTDSSQLTALDELIDTYSTTFQTALMYLQCYYYFVENDDVDGRNAQRKSDCWRNYNALKADFPTFSTENLVTTGMATVSRG